MKKFMIQLLHKFIEDNLITILRELAKRTDNKIDDKIVNQVERAIGDRTVAEAYESARNTVKKAKKRVRKLTK